MPSKHTGTLSVVGVTITGSFTYDNKTHLFMGVLASPSEMEFPNLSATLMLGGASLDAGDVEFTGDFGPGGIVIAMNSISASINVQLKDEIDPYKINGGGSWSIN